METPHKKLDLWKTAMELVVWVYDRTDRFPKDERFGLREQIPRAANRVPSNIAEGAARQTKKSRTIFTSLRVLIASLTASLSSLAGSVSWRRPSGSGSMNRCFGSTK